MDARTFLKKFRYDERLITGGYYPLLPIEARPGETIGVVLMNMGGANTLADVEPFLYHLFMDPAIIDLPFGGILRHWLSKLISTRRSKKVGKDYDRIGGGSPINRLTQGQAKNLESALNRRFGDAVGIKFRVYVAMRYGHPTAEKAAQEMQNDNVNKVVLLPLYPQYSKTTTGSSLSYWWMLEQSGEIPKWPTTYIFEYAAHPKYIQALSSRIDEALERFPVEVRSKVQLVFSAHGTPLYEMKKRRDPYCCLIHSTVEQVMNYRSRDYPFHVSFQSKVGPAEWLTPSTPDKLKELADNGNKAVLLVPVAFVTDHIETLFELDMEVRKEALEFGIQHYEVTGGLNSHPLFIDALADAAALQVILPGAEKMEKFNVQIPDCKVILKYSSDERQTRCHQCEDITEAIKWQEASIKASG